MSDFIVRFHGVELSKDAAERLQASIQRTVLAEVSSLPGYTPNPDDPDSGGGSLAFLPNIHWRGIIYLPAAVLAEDSTVLGATLRVTSEARE